MAGVTDRLPPGAESVSALGDAALLLRVGGPMEARTLAEQVRRSPPAGVEDVVGGLRSVLVAVEPGTDLERVSAALGSLDRSPVEASEPRRHRFPVVLAGPDVDDVCRATAVGRDDLAELLAGAVLEVAMVGFSPGFAYLQGLPPPLRAVPRRPSPRPAVPAGSFAVGGGFAAVYPQSTPGGWQVVGHTPVRVFDPTAPPYALLRPGDAVRLVPVDGGGDDATGSAEADREPSARQPLVPPPGSGADLVVEAPGVLTVAQDAGRAGLAHLGVPAAGPADPLAHALANRLVGNPPGTTALEVTARGPVLRNVAPAPLYVAVVGADPEVMVDGHVARAGHVMPLAPGQRLAVGTLATGLRSYLAVAGGLSLPPLLGSASTDMLCALGPGPLATKDAVALAGPPGPMADHLGPDAWRVLSKGQEARRTLRVLPGPHPEWFGAGVVEELAGQAWVVEGTSNRVGVRLRPAGGDGLARRPGEIDSVGMVTGAVQVPPDGRPVILGPDHATLGGYPVVAVVVSADRWLLGQCRPGDEIAFQPVTPGEAMQALAEVSRAARSVSGTYPAVVG
jgi:KipI family sensor histidine kinase inhibitor